MSWFKVDDKFHSAEEVLSIPRAHRLAAIGLWTLAGAWSSDHLKDGHVPLYVIEQLGATLELADVLVRATLWERTEVGYRFRNWAKWQQTREEVEGKRRATAERVRAFRERRAGISGDGHEDVTRYERVGNAAPDPTRPDPSLNTPDGVKRATRGTRLDRAWKPSELLEQWTKAKAPSVNIESETETFVDYWTARAGQGGVKLDWDATWRTWAKRTHERNVERGWRPDAGAPRAGYRDFGQDPA